jgi:hypothetical protein
LTNVSDNDIIVYTVSDIQRIMSLGRTRAYELMRSDGFPSIKLNNRIYITKKNFEKWLDKNTNKVFRY